MDLRHVRMGPAGKTTHIHPPPPPTIKGRTVGGVQNLLSAVDLSIVCSDLCALVNLHSDPPPPPPI
jgi:hypothetical protein